MGQAIAADAPSATQLSSQQGDNYNPPTGSVYWELPAGLRQKLGDTFVAIQLGNKDSEGHTPTDAGQLGLQNTLKGAFPDTWGALDNMPSVIINLYRMIYDRVVALAPQIWDQVIWIRWAWISTSMGFNVTYKDPAAAKSVFNGAATSTNSTDRAICFESRDLSWYFHKNCDCWRELPATAAAAKRDPEGLHILVGDRPANPLADQIHIDPIDPYKFRDDDGTCKITPDADMVAHLQQVFVSGHDIHSPFTDMPGVLRQVQGDVNAGWATNVDDEKKEVAAIADSWAKEERSQACKGRSGWLYFQDKLNRLRAISRKLDGMRPASPAPASSMPLPDPGPPPASP